MSNDDEAAVVPGDRGLWVGEGLIGEGGFRTGDTFECKWKPHLVPIAESIDGTHTLNADVVAQEAVKSGRET